MFFFNKNGMIEIFLIQTQCLLSVEYICCADVLHLENAMFKQNIMTVSDGLSHDTLFPPPPNVNMGVGYFK